MRNTGRGVEAGIGQVADARHVGTSTTTSVRYFVWCYEHCFKPRCDALRQRIASDTDAAVVMVKASSKLESWLARAHRMPYVLLTGWREAKPCIEVFSWRQLSELMVVCCTCLSSFHHASVWARGLEPGNCCGVHITMEWDEALEIAIRLQPSLCGGTRHAPPAAHHKRGRKDLILPIRPHDPHPAARNHSSRNHLGPSLPLISSPKEMRNDLGHWMANLEMLWDVPEKIGFEFASPESSEGARDDMCESVERVTSPHELVLHSALGEASPLSCNKVGDSDGGHAGPLAINMLINRERHEIAKLLTDAAPHLYED